MSKHNNVNPGQYKVAGRERPGDDIPEAERARGAGHQPDEEAQRRWDEQQRQRESGAKPDTE